MTRDNPYAEWVAVREPGDYSDRQIFEAGYRAGAIATERKLPLDPEPYQHVVTLNRLAHGGVMLPFRPRPGYSQVYRDYPQDGQASSRLETDRG
jgi:hypothetical protein